jgi:hypothetical protein
VRPLQRAHGDSGIPLRNDRSLPFVVARSWSAPAGVYREQWFLVDPATREVLFEGPAREAAIWGLQSLTDITDEVRAPVNLRAGTYLVVFALSGVMGGAGDVEASETDAGEAA